MRDRNKIHAICAAASVFFLVFGINTAAAADLSRAGQYGESDYRDFSDICIPEEGCALFIDLDAYIMTVYLNADKCVTYPVSGGTYDTPSPVGAWFVSEISNWGEGFGGSWIGLDVPWGVYGIHGTRKPWLVGKKNVSHGCIRMRDEDVSEVKKLVSRGSLVYIKQDSLPLRETHSGMTGSDVMKTQRMLQGLGFYTGKADGIFGKGMEYAVRSFQKTYGLEVSGKVERLTYDKIQEQYRNRK